ncbi:MAG: hypothetical protein EOM61_08545 [Bacteroidia bacterium]|nr:hypothetical protein [Bacteroidia bacterium]
MEKLIGLIGIVCAIWVIYEVWANHKSMSVGEKILWTIAAIIFNIITAIVFYFFKKR